TKVILICGKSCCGKSTYAEKLRKELGAAVLSVDEIMLAIFGRYVGEKHDEYCENLQKYLFDKSLELIESGVNVILDWGFWQKDERDYAKDFYKLHNANCEFHYLNISSDMWQKRLNKRNKEVEEGKTDAYLVDENLARKFDSLFEPPSENEIDVWINC
ncbi:MAG: ATP-binding protein, partial [[Eubacterium] siraeum]|nr:ATP-binding protein [[Eubacterium] siraeum]